MGDPVAPTPAPGAEPAARSAPPQGTAGPTGPFGPRYSLLQRIGGGGLGAVHLAYDHRLERFVAVKRVRPDRAGDTAMRILQDEARAASRLRHNAIVAVYEILPEAPAGVALVLELVEGASLRHRIRKQGPMPLPEAVPLLAEVGRALAFAHAQGVVHRDVKPGNILIGAGNRPKLLDFGIAHVAGEAASTAGAAAGTNGYAAPEQAAGKPGDHRVDVYALGMTLREAVTGVRPEGAAPPLPHPGLAAIIERATHPDPEQRYPQMGDFVRALETLVPEAARRPDAVPLPERPPLAPACLRRLEDAPAAWPVGERATIGRSGRASIRVRHPTLSRVHAKIVRRRTGEAYLFDLGSLNGVRVNGREVLAGPIEADSVVGIGDVRFRYEEGSHAAVSAPPAAPHEPATEPALRSAPPDTPAPSAAGADNPDEPTPPTAH